MGGSTVGGTSGSATGGAGGSTTVGVVLAAGAGRRMGGPKALLRFRGTPLVDHVVRIARAGGCDPVIVVLGAGAAEAEPFAVSAGAQVVVNEQWADGMGISLRVGLTAAASVVPEASAALVLLVDQPYVTSAAVAEVRTHAEHDPPAERVLAAASYQGFRGHPVLLGRGHWTELSAFLTGDAGARKYLHAHSDEVILVPCENLADPHDLDVPEDLLRDGSQ
jgi:nicotine blue oxidoreductase